MLITGDYFLSEYHAFRKIMCSRKYTIKQKDDAFAGLTCVYLNVPADDPKIKTCKAAYEALFEEYPKRIVYEVFRGGN